MKTISHRDQDGYSANRRPPWQKMRDQLVREDAGQSLVMVSLMMTIFLGVLGLVIDYGQANMMQRQMQYAADAAAIAGAKELAVGQAGQIAALRMQNVLAANGADLSRSQASVNNGQATASASVNLSTSFLSLFGISEVPIQAVSRAGHGQIIESDNLMPFAVEEDQWILGEIVILWGDKNGPGNFGWVRWNGQTPNTPTLRLNLLDPSRSDIVVVGVPVNGHTGVSFNAVKSELDTWLGREITVFLYDANAVTGSGANLQYYPTGFARFIMTATMSAGSNSQIVGTFVEYVALGASIDYSSHLGMQGVGLIE